MTLLALNDATLAFEPLPTTTEEPLTPDTTAPACTAGTNKLWEFEENSNSDNVLMKDGTRGGLFADYDCKGSKVYVAQVNEDQSAITGGGFRDSVTVLTMDSDTTDYSAIGQKVTNGVRAFTQGEYSSGAFQPMYKDLVGAYFAASGNVQWEPRGVSAITCDAYQYGSGIASNEFAVHNPDTAGGGQSQSKSMAAVQAIVRSRYADEDATHVSRGVFISNNGKRITYGVQIISDATEGHASHYKYGVHMGGATVSAAAIVMPASASGNSGTVIEYDVNDYTVFDRAANRHYYVIAGTVPFAVHEKGIKLGTLSAPTAPQNGDMWFDGTGLKLRVGGVTKTVTLS